MVKKMKSFSTSELTQYAHCLKAGDEISLSGVVYTARDAAHKRIMTMLENGEKLPFDINGSIIYYAGPTPTRPGRSCGSFGPTTSCRMDSFAPALYDLGMLASIGKGGRSKAVTEAIKRNGGLYLLAIGGAGAFAAKHICSVTEIAFKFLGCESVKQVVFKDFPLYVGIDTAGDSIFERQDL